MGKAYNILIFIIIAFLIYLYIENMHNKRNRDSLDHVIHINGTRGKSTVTRLIHAGLSKDYKVFAKTTGTLPMTIDTKSKQKLINRKGKANIKEQIEILHLAKNEGANILAIECMAVDPILQKISQEKILNADITVITNVRIDHTDEMGSSLSEICNALSNTIPENGILITAEETMFNELKENCKKKNTKIIKAIGKPEYNKIDFIDNVACAIEACKILGISEKNALENMKNYIKDPYRLQIYKLFNGAFFINGLSVNDPLSSKNAYTRAINKIGEQRNLTLIINNRKDRGYRARQMLELARLLNPTEVILLGAFKNIVTKELPDINTKAVNSAEEIDFSKFSIKDTIYAVGNIGGGGEELINRIKDLGEEYV